MTSELLQALKIVIIVNTIIDVSTVAVFSQMIMFSGILKGMEIIAALLCIWGIGGWITISLVYNWGNDHRHIWTENRS